MFTSASEEQCLSEKNVKRVNKNCKYDAVEDQRTKGCQCLAYHVCCIYIVIVLSHCKTQCGSLRNKDTFQLMNILVAFCG